ncbi:MAG: DUF262 domain-containing protein [Candidatus Omnitrophica bacterium]|nr:DUF262 domain-containing protein [Candidatus Omnitrophota bacterium]
MDLGDEIDRWRKEIRTDGYPMSIGEWISLYENEEIDIHPEFQRFYRWTETQKTKLIESILLGIPIPPIFVSQRKDGVWDVVDGLQRLATIYQFIGILKDENKKNVPPLILEGTGYLPSLEGKKWNDPDDPDESLTPEQRLIVKRSKISTSIILRESDELAKFELFQRLNTGGSNLTPQEVRNCILVMVNPEMYRWLRKLANYEPFQECINLSENPLIEQYDMELALRFIVFSTIYTDELINIGDVGVFLTNGMIRTANNKRFDYNAWELSFNSTFDLLARTTGPDSFRKYSPERNKSIGGFVLSPFEVIAFGLGYNVTNPPNDKEVPALVKSLWENETYRQWSGSGMTATRRLPKLIPLGRDLFNK